MGMVRKRQVLRPTCQEDKRETTTFAGTRFGKVRLMGGGKWDRV